MPFFKRILFFIFVLIYVLLCPLIIFRTLGLVFTPKAEEGILKTGLIAISTLPAGATIHLNNRIVSERTPTILHNLAPGYYTLNLSLPQYRLWEKDIEVIKEQATALEHVILIPQEWEYWKHSALSFERILPLPGNPFLLAFSGPTLKDISILRWQAMNRDGSWQEGLTAERANSADHSSEPLFLAGSAFSDARLISIDSVRGSPVVIFHIEFEGKKKFLWMDLRNKQRKIEDITDLIAATPQEITWDAEDGNNLFMVMNDHIDRIHIPTRAIYPKILDNPRGFGLFGRHIYFLSLDNTLYIKDFSGERKKSLTQDPRRVQNLFTSHSRYDIQVLAHHIILFADSEGGLLINQLPYHLLSKDFRNFLFDADSKRVLVWTPDAIAIVDFSESGRGDVFEPGTPIQWITTDGQDIEQVFWVNGGTSILYRDRNQIFLKEVAAAGEPLRFPLLSVKPGSPVHYSDTSGRLYFLDKKTGELLSIEILPKQIIVEKENPPAAPAKLEP